jgi:hypothetical protein
MNNVVFLERGGLGLVAPRPGVVGSPGFDSGRYQIVCLVVGLERGLLSVVWINEELLFFYLANLQSAHKCYE